MAGPPNLFILLFFYNRYKKRVYNKNEKNLTEKKPLPFILWFLRGFVIIFIFILLICGINNIMQLFANA